MKKLRMLSLCSGIGGADLAAEWTSHIEIVGQVEINPFCQRVLAAHWPHVKRAGDIREVQGDEFGAIDIIVGGIPCQPFSSAGKQRGQEDDRYLWPEMLRIVMRACPAWVVIENVDDFTYLALDNVSADLESQGYAVQAFVLPACSVGAPHLRQRCFVVAHHSGKRSGAWWAESAGQQWTANAHGDGSSDVADAHSNRWGQRAGQSERQPTRSRASDIGSHGTQRTLADAEHGGCEWGMFNAIQSGAALFSRSAATGTEPQSGMDRMLHGISARLDSARWPSLRGVAPQEWEPQGVVCGKVKTRRKRIEALGNAIVPYQIYPFFVGIVEWERTREDEAA